MLLQIKDYDSGYQPSKTIDKKVIGIGGFLVNLAFQIPIFTVSEKTMDMLAPPKKVLNRKCLTEMLEGYRDVYYKEEGEYEKDEEQIFNVFSKGETFERCRKDLFYNVGAFITHIPSNFIDQIDVPAIIISPDRIRNWANSKRKTGVFVNLMSFVILHELVHAYVYNRKLDRSKFGYASSVIEESLADATAYSHFPEKDRVTNLSELLLDPSRPPEYTSYVYWAETFRVVDPLHVLLLWRRGVIPVMYLHGVYLPPPNLDPYYHFFLHEFYHVRLFLKDKDLANELAAEILLHS